MIFKNIQRRAISSVSEELSSFPPLLQRVYAARNIQQKNELESGLSNLLDYRMLSNIDAATDALIEMINSNARVVIVGDFDADGATSTALLMLALSAMGLKNLEYTVPNRFEYGYGLSEKIVDEVAKKNPDWIITVDNGISNHQGVKRAKEKGIKVLITDHHLPGESLPEADVIINPNLPGDRFPSKALAGVGVAFYVLIALRAKLREQNYFSNNNLSEPNLAEWLDLVALGTVADVVPLDANNRRIVAQGLERIRAGRCRPGILLLLQAGKRKVNSLEASDLGFAVGPRLNAAGRLEDMSLGIECLLADTESAAAPMAFELDGLNQYRREIEQEMVEQAVRVVDKLGSASSGSRPNAVCLFDEEWHQGVVGLVASRMKEKLNRPVIAFAEESEDTIKGSGRSVPGVHMRDVLANLATNHPQILSKFGGHAMAAGLSINRSDFAEFCELFEQEVNHWLGDEVIEDVLVTDGTLEDHEFSLETAIQLKNAGPWGQAFPEPSFDDEFEVINQRVVGEKHLKLVLRKKNSSIDVDAIFFFCPELLLIETLSTVEVVYRLSINEFRDETNLQLIVEQLRPIV
ncbi:single-stranded-DNA-specific exonuclease RecJ [Pleionea sediminis]|uniref:single-stranded-DNA-specific exonuclease RecJ n=1 Tax=Pleionea sediminis TaxID=2569479 RepID=UPI001184CA90|nr:single-stranded-DNA-specific exonuclease RecJ [Pleionea sediminis]